MESNGKSVLNTMPGVKIDFAAGVINFGEPGTSYLSIIFNCLRWIAQFLLITSLGKNHSL